MMSIKIVQSTRLCIGKYYKYILFFLKCISIFICFAKTLPRHANDIIQTVFVTLTETTSFLCLLPYSPQSFYFIFFCNSNQISKISIKLLINKRNTLFYSRGYYINKYKPGAKNRHRLY